MDNLKEQYEMGSHKQAFTAVQLCSLVAKLSQPVNDEFLNGLTFILNVFLPEV